MAIHFSTIAWKIPWTEEPGRLQSMGSQRVGHDWATSLLQIRIWRLKEVRNGHIPTALGVRLGLEGRQPDFRACRTVGTFSSGGATAVPGLLHPSLMGQGWRPQMKDVQALLGWVWGSEVGPLWSSPVWLRRSRFGNPLQYSCLENAMDRGA